MIAGASRPPHGHITTTRVHHEPTIWRLTSISRVILYHLHNLARLSRACMACHASQLQLLLPHPSLGALEPGRVEEQLVVHRVLYQAGPHLCSLLENELGVHGASAPDSYTLERGQVHLRACKPQACNAFSRSAGFTSAPSIGQVQAGSSLTTPWFSSHFFRKAANVLVPSSSRCKQRCIVVIVHLLLRYLRGSGGTAWLRSGMNTHTCLLARIVQLFWSHLRRWHALSASGAEVRSVDLARSVPEGQLSAECVRQWRVLERVGRICRLPMTMGQGAHR